MQTVQFGIVRIIYNSPCGAGKSPAKELKMENKKTLKDYIKDAVEHYDKHANFEKCRADQATEGSNIQKEIMYAYQFNRGRAAAMREVLAFIEEYIG